MAGPSGTRTELTTWVSDFRLGCQSAAVAIDGKVRRCTVNQQNGVNSALRGAQAQSPFYYTAIKAK